MHMFQVLPKISANRIENLPNLNMLVSPIIIFQLSIAT